ncbi:MAG: glucose-1-phosphate adenylyltransferase [Candidatus Omnitrophica bacterium]|nr:glucose-1-phosphate adenylyltransferase [Candidatus Omnitrophota bacterium]
MLHNKVLAIILGGGKGSRLYPLTKHRCKPAISFGGKYRLIDIPISNCLNSQINQIYVLTQFLTSSIHRHIFETYRMDMLTRGFVEILPAEQTLTSSDWYQGTADAVRRSIKYFRELPVEDILILSGDQLCAMNYMPIYEFHKSAGANLTIIGHPVSAEEAPRMGVIQVNRDQRILKMIEKPKDLNLVKGFEMPDGKYIASTGNYFFKKNFLLELLTKNYEQDFGKEIIPKALDSGKVFMYLYNDYWEDIGTIKSFFEANLDLAQLEPKFNLYNEDRRIFTHPRFIPAAKIQNSQIITSLISEGSLIDNAYINHAVIGIRGVIRSNTKIIESIILGNDFYERDMEKEHQEPYIGSNVHIEQAIIDKNVVVEDGVVIRGSKNSGQSFDGDLFSVRDGIVVVSKGTHIPKGTVIEVGK